MATNNLSVSGTANWIGAALGTTYRAITMLLVRTGTDARMHFRTGLSAAGGSNSGYALQCVDDDNASPSNVDLWLFYRNLYFGSDVRFKNGMNLQTTADDISFAEGSSGDVLTSGGSGASMSWTAPSGGQTACVRVYLTADQSIATNTEIVLPFAGETFDVGGFHDNVTDNSRLTVPSGEAGKYWMAARVHWTPSSADRVATNIKINGAPAAHTNVQNGNAAAWGWNYDIFDLADGDYVECVVYQNSGGTMTVQFHSSADSGVNAGTTLMMHRLS